MSNVLTEYLVGLDFSVQDHSYRDFESYLKRAEMTVDHHSTGMLNTVLKTQTGILSGFTAVSAGILGMAERVSMADQSYRLLGLHMLMTTDSARKMDMITKTLGVDMKDIIWDKELHERAVLMSQDIDRMNATDPDAEKNMKRVRDFRNEFARLSITAQFFERDFVSSILKAFGGGNIDTGFRKLHDFVDWAQSNLPHWADSLATKAVPILKDTWGMLVSVKDAAKEAGVVFTNTVGILADDESIQGTTFSIEKMAGAFTHIANGAKTAFDAITDAEKMFLHFATGVTKIAMDIKPVLIEFADGIGSTFTNVKNILAGFLQDIENSSWFKKLEGVSKTAYENLKGVLGSAMQSAPVKGAEGAIARTAEETYDYWVPEKSRKDFSDVTRRTKDGIATYDWSEFKEGAKSFGTGSGVVSGIVAGGATGAVVGGLGAIPGAIIGGIIGGLGGHVAEYYRNREEDLPLMPYFQKSPVFQEPAQHSISIPEFGGKKDRPPTRDRDKDILDRIKIQATLKDVPFPMAAAVAQQESHFDPYAMSTFTHNGVTGHAFGIMQLTPDTAKHLGVEDPLNANQNIEGGVRYLHELLDRYHDDVKALAAYNAGPRTVDKAIEKFGAKWFDNLPEETRKYVPMVEGLERQFRNQDALAYLQRPTEAMAPSVTNNSHSSISVTVGDVNLVGTKADPRHAQDAVMNGAMKAIEQSTQNTMIQTAPAY